MKSRPIEITALADGTPAKAELFLCSGCGGEQWLVYVIAGHQGPHLQCEDCGATYCGDGEDCASIPPPAGDGGRKCRACGCTETMACVVEGVPCHWVAEDLCSACAAPAGGGKIILPGDPNFAV